MTTAALPPAFQAYTAFPAVEQPIEQVLGPAGKFTLSERSQLAYVRYLPWIALLFLPLHIASVLFLLGVTALASLVGGGSFISALISVAVLVLDIIALPGLFNRTRRGWAFFTYAAIVSEVGNLTHPSVLGLLVGVLVVWLAFQVKYQYR